MYVKCGFLVLRPFFPHLPNVPHFWLCIQDNIAKTLIKVQSSPVRANHLLHLLYLQFFDSLT